MGSEEPQLITASRFLTITAEKGRDTEVLWQQGTLSRTLAMYLLWRASTPLLAGMVTPSLEMMAMSMFCMLWVTIELRRASARPSRNSPLHSILNMESILI